MYAKIKKILAHSSNFSKVKQELHSYELAKLNLEKNYFDCYDNEKIIMHKIIIKPLLYENKKKFICRKNTIGKNKRYMKNLYDVT